MDIEGDTGNVNIYQDLTVSGSSYTSTKCYVGSTFTNEPSSSRQLIVRNNGDNGINLHAPNANNQFIDFGDDTNGAFDGRIIYRQQSNRQMEFYAGGVQLLDLDGPNSTVDVRNASLTVASDLTVDTNTLYVDSTNNKVGIGTTTPAEQLEVVGSIIATNRLKAGGDTASSEGGLALFHSPTNGNSYMDAIVDIGQKFIFRINDTSGNPLNAYSIDANGAFQADGAVIRPRTSVTTATYNVTSTDFNIWVNFAGAVTITIPDAENVNGRELVIRDRSGNASTNNITVKGATQTVNGLIGGVQITSDYGVLRLTGSGIIWLAD
jgi:hypothetical protein